MKIRKSAAQGTDKVDMQMTPMIDIVFQLLTFFVMSFKIATQEGDFNIKMPLAGPSENVMAYEIPPIPVQLLADANGNLAGISMGTRRLANFAALHNEIIGIVGTDTGPSSMAANAEVEIDAAHDLHYKHVVQAITAISGYIDENGRVVKLIEKLKFAPPRAAS